MNGSKPILKSDDVRQFANQNGALCRVRVRTIQLNDTLAILFSENRNPQRFPGAEVENPGTSITNMIEELAHLAEVEWGLIPEGRKVRFFEHYFGSRPMPNGDEEATISEITFQSTPNLDFAKSTRTRDFWAENDNGEKTLVVQVTGRGNWLNPS